MLDPAVMDATSRPLCLDGTRQDILHILIDDLTAATPEANVIWLCGVAGSGKSTIATTVAEQLHDRGQRGAFLFFDRNSPAHSGPSGVIRTLACQLAFSNDVLRDAICDAIELDPQIATRPLESQFKALVLAPLRSCASKMSKPMVIILDAFDECGDPQSRKALVHLLSTQLPQLPNQFRLLVTSRPELDLTNAFGSHPVIKSISLNAAKWASSADVLCYLHHELDGLYQARRRSDELPPGWPGAEKLEKFGSRASDSFIWAATAIRFLDAGDDLDECLDRLLSQQAISLGGLYATALRSASNWDPDQVSTETCRRVLGAVVVGRIPLTDDVIDGMLGLEHSKSCRRILRRLGCLLQWSEGLPIRTLHASFADYLTDARACGDQPWFIDQSKHHTDFTIGCFQVMKRLLRFNTCGLETSYLMNRDVPCLAERIDAHIPPTLRYACLFWHEHLRHGNTSRDVQRLILEFFRASFLYWLEVLSLMGEGRVAWEAMVIVKRHIIVGTLLPESAIQDGSKFVRAFASIISDSAPHVYLSALPFAPSTSIIRQHYSSVIKNTLHVDKNAIANWPSCEQVIEGRTGPWTRSPGIGLIVFSPDGEHIASGSQDNTICIWDAHTGALVADPFEGHTEVVNSLAFSLDGERVMSGSDDCTIRIWDATTGKLLVGPLEGHNEGVLSVGFSPNSEQVTSFSRGNTIRVWDARSGKLIAGPFSVGDFAVSATAFSPDGKQVALGSWDGDICICDARSGKLIAESMERHCAKVKCVAFSLDGSHVVSGGNSRTVHVWDASTGKLVAGPFKGHTDAVRSVAFSPDSELVASGSSDATVCIWDARTGALVAGPLEGHTARVRCVAFSPDGKRVVSGSKDNTIRIWDIRVANVVPGLKGGIRWVHLMVHSADGERIVSIAKDGAVYTWDACTGELVAGPFKTTTVNMQCMAVSPDGECIASRSSYSTIHIWTVRSGKLLTGPLEHTARVTSVVFSPNGKFVASGSSAGIWIWDTRTGELVAGPCQGHSRDVTCLAFSLNGERLASGTDDGTTRIWDASTGKLVAGPFKGHIGAVRSVALSPDGERMASGSQDKTICIWDVHTGTLVASPLKGHTEAVLSVAFSPDGKYVVSGSRDKTVRIWDAHTGELVAGPFKDHIGSVHCVAFSANGERVVSGSLDGTIRIFDMPRDSEASPSRKGYTASSQLDNGWMRNSPTELLFWVPPAYRAGLWQPYDTLVLGQPSTRLDLTDFVHGENWAQCHV
ncbi:WD40 repeat-like protein [Athelia psychrophila]|uniref:WD40 repeat-like protein n=1 Tax=Athelia psychrophila TaxID=1759441 RepID=A0A167UTL3_9AGAM|nr:WD40 repeat-like protein [Fibularhizoctonia sp. CBS 109695]